MADHAKLGIRRIAVEALRGHSRGFNAFTVTNDPAALNYLAGESGVATLIALTAVSAWLATRLPARMAQPAKA